MIAVDVIRRENGQQTCLLGNSPSDNYVFTSKIYESTHFFVTVLTYKKPMDIRLDSLWTLIPVLWFDNDRVLVTESRTLSVTVISVTIIIFHYYTEKNPHSSPWCSSVDSEGPWFDFRRQPIASGWNEEQSISLRAASGKTLRGDADPAKQMSCIRNSGECNTDAEVWNLWKLEKPLPFTEKHPLDKRQLTFSKDFNIKWIGEIVWFNYWVFVGIATTQSNEAMCLWMKQDWPYAESFTVQMITMHVHKHL
jgi:hypothetical protein